MDAPLPSNTANFIAKSVPGEMFNISSFFSVYFFNFGEE